MSFIIYIVRIFLLILYCPQLLYILYCPQYITNSYAVRNFLYILYCPHFPSYSILSAVSSTFYIDSSIKPIFTAVYYQYLFRPQIPFIHFIVRSFFYILYCPQFPLQSILAAVYNQYLSARRFPS